MYSLEEAYKRLGNIMERQDKEDLRYEARRMKPTAMAIHKDECQVCNNNCEEILVMHHIKPIGQGGDNSINNLSILCPNCHTIVHKVMNHLNNDRDFRVIGDWIKENMTINQYAEIMKLSSRGVVTNE